MTKRILSTKRPNYNPNNKFNSGLRLIVEFYKEPAQKLIKELVEKNNYNLDQIAEIIGISRDAVRDNWLKPIYFNL